MVFITSLLLAVAFTSGEVDHVLDRPLTWDSGGTVRIKSTSPVSEVERSRIVDMQKGNYDKVRRSVLFSAKKALPSLVDIWIVNESCRKTNDLEIMQSFAQDLTERYGVNQETIFAKIKAESLAYAVALRSNDPVALESAGVQLDRLVTSAIPLLKDCAPLALLVAGLQVGETQQKRSIAERLVIENPAIGDLKLWRIRAYINGPIYTPLEKGKPKRDSKGKIIRRIGPDGPDYDKAEGLLKDYEQEYSGDPRALYYRARIYAMRSVLFSRSTSEERTLREKAIQVARRFTECKGIPVPLKKNAEMFIKNPVPGSFVTLASE